MLPFISFDGLGPLLGRAATGAGSTSAGSSTPSTPRSWGSGAPGSCWPTCAHPALPPTPPTPSAVRRLVEQFLLPGLAPDATRPSSPSSAASSPSSRLTPGAPPCPPPKTLIGRKDVNDIDEILAVTNTDVRRGHPRRAATTPTPSSPGTTRRARARPSSGSTRRPRPPSGTARPTWTGRSRSTRRRWSPPTPWPTTAVRSTSAARSSSRWDDKPVDRVRRGVPELDAQPVHARRAGGAAVHGQDRRDGALDRRQVLRRHPGDGRGPPRRGLRQVPRREALGLLPGQRPPEDAARRHRRSTAGGT